MKNCRKWKAVYVEVEQQLGKLLRAREKLEKKMSRIPALPLPLPLLLLREVQTYTD
jgi:hypothetical protein